MSDSDKERAFQWRLGAKILSGDWDDETAKSVKINHDFPLLQEFFGAGWDAALFYKESHKQESPRS